MARVRKAKPRPTDQEALCLIWMRRQRAKDVMNEILHGISPKTITMPTPFQILDYLTNMVMCLEMMLKLLSNEWNSHEVSKMYEVISDGKPYPDAAFMASLKEAITDQKYLLSPAAGIVDHIPAMEYLHDFLFGLIQKKYEAFDIHIEQDLPDNFGHFLMNHVGRFYLTKSVGPKSRKDMAQSMSSFMGEIQAIKSSLAAFFAKGQKLSMDQFICRSLR
jgi:hypothetical protein